VAVKRGWGFQKIQTNTIKKIKESSPIKASRDMISKCMFVYIVYIEVNVHQILNIILNVKSKVARVE
jgi:hypothetical protein